MNVARFTRFAAVIVIAPALSCCASQRFSIHSLPPDTPAADNAVQIKQAATVAAAATSQSPGVAQRAAAAPNVDAGPPLTVEDVPSLYTYDPWERGNRFIYRFNARFDEALFLPVANGYRRIPRPVRAGVHNFFGNLSEVVSVVNYAAQLRPVPGVRSLGRFAINSTLGIGGLFDVATKMKLPSARTGFSSTLARWGMHPGPYFVIPILGPSTLRDGIGFFADFGLSYLVNVADLYRGNVSWALTPLNAIDVRSNTNFRYYSSGSPFEYDTIRFLYMRKTLIEDEGLRLWQKKARPDARAPAGQ